MKTIKINYPYPQANTISGGRRNYICGNDSAIGGGHNNHIGDITLTLSANCSFIGGGLNNRATGANSAILGGANNNDGGLANVHIAGSGIAAVLPNTLHVNALWAAAIPFLPGGVGALPGQIYWDVPGTPGMALYIG